MGKELLLHPFLVSIITAPHSLGVCSLFSNMGVWEITLTTTGPIIDSKK